MNDVHYDEVMETIEKLATMVQQEFITVHHQFSLMHGEFGKVQKEFGVIRKEMKDMRKEISAEIRTEITKEIGGLHQGMVREIGGLRQEMREGFMSVHAEIGLFRQEMRGIVQNHEVRVVHLEQQK